MKTKTVFMIEREFEDDSIDCPTYFGVEYSDYETAKSVLDRYFKSVSNAVAIGMKNFYPEIFRIIEIAPKEISAHRLDVTGEVTR